jgi:hypothetical protein
VIERCLGFVDVVEIDDGDVNDGDEHRFLTGV